jgi:type I restriction enzyme S subunit
VGIIPVDWDCLPLIDCVYYIHGKAHEQYIEEYGKYIVVNSKFISTDGNVKKFSNISFCTAVTGDVLTVLSDLPNGKALAKCFVVNKNNTFAVNQRVCIWRPKSNVESKYLFYVLNRNRYFLSLNDGVSQTHILNHHIEKCRIQLPATKIEQIAIATALSDIDELISQTEKLIDKKKAIKQGVMQELLRPKDDWVKQTIKEIVKIPVTDGPHETPRFVKNGIPFLSVNNIVDNRIDYSDLRFISKFDDNLYSKKCKPQKNDILMGKAASVGKVALVTDERDFNIWSPLALIRIKDDYSYLYTFYYFQTHDVKNQIDGLTNSSSQGNIGMGDIEKLVFSYPRDSKRRIEIGLILSDIDESIFTLKNKLQKLKLQKQGMMQALLTGKIRLI